MWAFLSEQVRIILFEVHKDGATLATLLPKDLFGGVLVSDDAAVYRGFTLAQKCWARHGRFVVERVLVSGRGPTTRSVPGMIRPRWFNPQSDPADAATAGQ